METPKKPGKKSAVTKQSAEKKEVENPVPAKPRSKFLDDEEDVEFDEPIDELGAFEHFEGLENEDDDY